MGDFPRPVRLTLILGLGLLLVLSACASHTVMLIELKPEPVPTHCEPHEMQGSFIEPYCQSRVI